MGLNRKVFIMGKNFGRFIKGGIALTAWLVTQGCGPSSTDCNLTNVLCSCDRSTQSSPDCRDYTAISKTSAASKCTTAGGTISNTALCSTTARAGTCKETEGTDVTYRRYYLVNYSTAASGAAACAYLQGVCQATIGALGGCDYTFTSDI